MKKSFDMSRHIRGLFYFFGGGLYGKTGGIDFSIFSPMKGLFLSIDIENIS